MPSSRRPECQISYDPFQLETYDMVPDGFSKQPPRGAAVSVTSQHLWNQVQFGMAQSRSSYLVQAESPPTGNLTGGGI